MQSETLVALAAAGGAIAAAGASWVSLRFAARASNAAAAQTEIQRDQTRLQQRAADAAMAQTDLQRQIAEEAAHPYIWVDVRPDEAQGTAFNLVLGNSGPTFAHNVRATIYPPLSDGGPSSRAEAAQRRLRHGIKALGPGRKLVWFIGVGFKIVKDDVPQRHTITIDADGPHGPIPTMTYEIDLADLRETRDAPEGNLHYIRKAIESLEGALPQLRYPVRVIVENQDGQSPTD
ncbi:hypothetical protein QCN29_09830 [Streptomyces sp. HNM0663]|uniref:Secreted protein n=1 Tax=Streptomyces chengmaiensis TaxID=3040919 RepID=A0ABT6HK34_9ACTN|nr:hypothetical protein [Streptomyces chengmaiensis]MDH2389085.1 hypothetical protein [Streptomyces chengmaiensis]